MHRPAASNLHQARPLRVGLILPETEHQMDGGSARWRDLHEMAQLGEAIGVDSLWITDHLIHRPPDKAAYGMWECWSLIAALAVVPNFFVREPAGQTVTEAELRMLIDIGAEEGSVSEEEADLLDRVFHFHDRRVNEIMIPRPEIVWLEDEDTLRDALDTFGESPRIASCGASEIDRPAIGSPLPMAAKYRLSQPSVTDLLPGAAFSMKSCASKCERDGSVLPARWMASSSPVSYIPFIWVHSGKRPKPWVSPPLSCSSVPAGTAMSGRTA